MSEGQETKKTTQNLEITTGLLCYNSGRRPVLSESKAKNVITIKNNEKGTPGLYFLVTLQNGKFKEIIVCTLLYNYISDGLQQLEVL